MESVTTPPMSPDRQDDPPGWQELAAACRTAVALSREIAVRLQQGSPACDLLPLLRHQLAQAGQLQTGISQLAPEPLSPASIAQRSQLLQGLQDLLAQEQENHRLLNRRGVKLSGVRPYRYTPRKAGSPSAGGYGQS